jgi:hypothetical protein
MQHDAWFFIGIFVFIFLIWAATGGPTRPLSFAGPTLAQPQELGGGTYLQLPRAPFSIGGTNIVLPGSSGGGSEYGPSSLYGVAFGASSPYRESVRINHYVSNASSTDPRAEYIEIVVAQNASAVDITGWTLRSEATHRYGIVPNGIALPILNVINPRQNIVLQPGQNAIIASGKSPIGSSFRENKCVGYLGNFQNYTPYLPNTCPSAASELAAFYGPGYLSDPACADYAETMSRCQSALVNPPKISRSCRDFIVKHLNYNGCVNAHRYDADFNGNTWRVYLGQEKRPLWRASREVIKILDQNGKTVDAFAY